jgi:hypothetical protein
VLHHTEIVIVAGAEQAVWKYLIIAAATGHHPDGSGARRELVLPNLSSFDETEGLREPFLEYSCQSLLLVVGEDLSPIYLLTGSFEYPVFV